MVLANLSKLSIGDLPKNEMKKVIHMLQTHYMYVMGWTLGLNCTKFQYIAWKVLEIFVDKETASKISFHQESAPAEILQLFHPSQLEQRFGGVCETPKQFWPPIIPGSTYRNSEDINMNLVEEEDYQVLLQENPLLRPRPQFYNNMNRQSEEFIVRFFPTFDSNFFVGRAETAVYQRELHGGVGWNVGGAQDQLF